MGALESSYSDGRPDLESLYRARGEEVNPARPFLTGDVFGGLELPGSTGKSKRRFVIVLQHPCAMRSNGIDLRWQLLVAEVQQWKILEKEQWQGNYNVMPLPALFPELAGGKRNQAANFDNLYTVRPALLRDRVACLAPIGVNLLLQRWVHYNSRVIVPTTSFHEQSVSFYEEADLMEEWCDYQRVKGEEQVVKAHRECMEWLRTPDGNGLTPQELLRNDQTRSGVRRAMRAKLRSRQKTS